MKKQINLEEILFESLFKEKYKILTTEDKEVIRDQFSSFYKFPEVLEALGFTFKKALELASENAELNYGEDEGQSTSLNKNSILDIKKWVV